MNKMNGNESKLTSFVLMVFVFPLLTVFLASLIPLATTLLLTWAFDWPLSSALVCFAAGVIWNLASGNVRAMRLLNESRSREREMHSKASEILNRFASRN